MIQPEVDVAPVPRPLQLRQCLALVGERLVPDVDYPVGVYEVIDQDSGEVSLRVALIAILETEGRVLVAVPFSCWHRNISKRRLPPGALVKPVAATVRFVDKAEEAEEQSEEEAKVWLGYLAKPHEDCVVFEGGGEVEEPELLFSEKGASWLPTADSLGAAAEYLFEFETATSGPGREGRRQAAGAPVPVEDRISRLEESVGDLTEGIKRLLTQSGHPLEATSKAAPPCPPGLPAAGSLDGSPLDKLDLDVLKSARMAGVPEEQLLEMQRIASTGKPRLGDLPQHIKKVQRNKNVLSESEDEAAGGNAVSTIEVPSNADPMTAAIAKLTVIADHLTSGKQKANTLEALLDGSGSNTAADSTSSSSTSRRSAAALRLLRRSLVQNPKLIYEAVENHMLEDFQVRTQLPGSGAVPVSARAWLELRSKVQGYVTPVRLLWGIAGILDSLRAGCAEEARARACLLLCQGDQLSIERGSWLVAGELSLEEPPPLAAFHNHPLPTESEPPYSRLVDPRWMDLVLYRLNEFDSLQEKKKKLSRKPLPVPPNPTGKGDKGKGKGKGKAAASSEAAATPTE